MPTIIFEECLFEEEQHLSEITFLSLVQFRTDTPHIDIQQNVVVLLVMSDLDLVPNCVMSI